ncbi:LOW QUALITY PROTEIN: rho GTPase-activating protein conundrum-like [Atheta coriaria]|uniref:LOW QUALITY PROTEIN: rho GTPase-activating protein conundrum-like n=1 Tax=Dalotia coriaria TaxID=877792 RepID=UPI0031F3DDAB
MESIEVPHEPLRLYFTEVKDSQHHTNDFDVELLDEVEEASDFLQNAGLLEFSKLHQQGKEIPDLIVDETVRQKHLTVRQAETVRSRVRTLNKTLGNRQPRRKQRQDVRDVAWNLETSSTGSRSRSATPDSLDSTGHPNEESTSDEDHHNLSSFILTDGVGLKGKLKYTSSEPIPSKQVFSRHDRGDVAHLGSENVVLKGYHPLKEFGTNNRIPVDVNGDHNQVMDILTNNNNNIKEVTNVKNHYLAEFDSLLSKSDPTPCSQTSMAMGIDQLSFAKIVKQDSSNETLNKTVVRNGANYIHIDTLSDCEYQYLKPLLWVEVATIFDYHKINVQKRKASYKHKRGNVFGVNLSTLVMRDMPSTSDTSMVPQIYQTTLAQLNERIKEDGILRVAGQKQKQEQICAEIESKFYSNRGAVDTLFSQISVHDLTGVLKKLLRELPDPIFTMELFDMFFKSSLIPDQEEKLRALNILVLLLPIEHRSTFHLLLEFLINIVAHEQFNRMSVHNVAMISAPSFFPPRLLGSKCKDDKTPITKEQLTKEINDAAVCCNIMEILLKAADQLWMIPNELVEQAHEAQKRALDRKEKKARSKKKLTRSSTQYEPGAMLNPKIKREYIL